jgi:hypothetical protein
MSCGRPESVRSVTRTGSCDPSMSSMQLRSITALIAKALPVCFWQSRQWQQFTNIGGRVRR